MNTPSERVHLGLGSNQGDRADHLRQAVRAIAAWPEVRALRVSPVYETAHVVDDDDSSDDGAPDHLNLCLALEGAPEPDEILRRGQALERRAGRAPDTHQRPRPLDVDVLLAAGVVSSDPALTLPHPRLAQRRFVLQPLADLDPALTIAGTGATVTELLARPEVAAQRIERTNLELNGDA